MKQLLTWFILIGGIMGFIIPQYAQAASLSLSAPGGLTVGAGNIFTVNVNLNTQGADIQGVDLHYLKYNPADLEIQDESSTTSGVQITPGTLMTNTVANSVTTSTGLINFSQITSGGQSYNGSGILATIRFKALKSSGTTALSFDFTLNNTTDSNVASNGADLLTQASGLTLTLSPGSGTSTPTPTATPSPTQPPSGGGGGGGGGIILPTPTITPSASATPLPTDPLVYETNPSPGSSVGPVVIRKLTESTLGGTRIPERGSITGGVIVINAQLFDANNNRVKLELELRQTNEPFTGIATSMSTYVNPGETARIERGGLVPGDYKFRARASNIKLEKSEWLEFGNSPNIDFVMRVGSGGGTVVTPTPTPPSGRKPYPFIRTLRRGVKGPDVLALQNMLKDLGYNTGVLDGWYGLKALNAIKAFQATQGLGADGVFGPKTQAKFNLVYAGSLPTGTPVLRILRLGMRGDDVKALQIKLNSLGFNVGTPDGSYGPKTVAQVKAFQIKYSLGADGFTGPKTLGKLNSL